MDINEVLYRRNQLLMIYEKEIAKKMTSYFEKKYSVKWDDFVFVGLVLAGWAQNYDKMTICSRQDKLKKKIKILRYVNNGKESFEDNYVEK